MSSFNKIGISSEYVHIYRSGLVGMLAFGGLLINLKGLEKS